MKWNRRFAAALAAVLAVAVLSACGDSAVGGANPGRPGHGSEDCVRDVIDYYNEEMEPVQSPDKEEAGEDGTVETPAEFPISRSDSKYVQFRNLLRNSSKGFYLNWACTYYTGSEAPRYVEDVMARRGNRIFDGMEIPSRIIEKTSDEIFTVYVLDDGESAVTEILEVRNVEATKAEFAKYQEMFLSVEGSSNDWEPVYKTTAKVNGVEYYAEKCRQKNGHMVLICFAENGLPVIEFRELSAESTCTVVYRNIATEDKDECTIPQK